MSEDEEADREFRMIMELLRAMKEYVKWSLIFDGEIDLNVMTKDEVDEIATQEFEEVIGPIVGNKMHSTVPVNNEDMHAVLNAVARWRLDNKAGRPRPPGSA